MTPRPRLDRRLLRFLRPHKWRMIGTVVCSIVAAALDAFAFSLLIPFLNALFGTPQLIPLNKGLITTVQQRTIGWLLEGRNEMGALLVVIAVITLTVVVKNVFVWLGGQLGASLQEHVTRDLRDAVYRHLTRLPLGYFTRTKAGQTIARVLSDTEQTKAVVTELITRSVQNAAQIVTTLALQPILHRLRRGHRRLRNDYGEMASVLQEVIGGIRLVKSFRGEHYEERRFVEASGRYSSGMTRMSRISLLSAPLTEIIGTSIAVLVLWIGARQVLLSRTLTGSDLITFMILVMRLLPPLKQLSQMPATAQQSLAAAERLFDVLDRPTEAQLDGGRINVDALRDGIAFDRVSFAYDGEPVLSDISFATEKGEVIALVGASGAGKSTLVDLIPRFYEPTAGRVLLDGMDTREITLASLRSLIGIVSQDTILFNDTVLNNIAYGAAGRYTRAQVEAAARAANADGFISELPEGYDTILGERGTRLSGGQRQRIAIARALLTDPPILILDEATSALDTESERLVQEAIERLLAGRTVFVIAHRLSTVQHADRILVLERGRIVERGTHQELMQGRGAYHRLHALQFRGELAGSPTTADV
jgi:ATP-binding cassette, subfamily B, bacterial MsbA